MSERGPVARSDSKRAGRLGILGSVRIDNVAAAHRAAVRVGRAQAGGGVVAAKMRSFCSLRFHFPCLPSCCPGLL
jgi:hypothetical protein